MASTNGRHLQFGRDGKVGGSPGPAARGHGSSTTRHGQKRAEASSEAEAPSPGR